jgi:hypothetical protein
MRKSPGINRQACAPNHEPRSTTRTDAQADASTNAAAAAKP